MSHSSVLLACRAWAWFLTVTEELNNRISFLTHTNLTSPKQWRLHATPQRPAGCSACERSNVTLLTSKVISRTFLGIFMMPESPSSPDTHTQGLEVVMALLSFLMGMMTTRYGITAGAYSTSAPEQNNKHYNAFRLIAGYLTGPIYFIYIILLWNHRFRANALQQRGNTLTDQAAQQRRLNYRPWVQLTHTCLCACLHVHCVELDV